MTNSNMICLHERRRHQVRLQNYNGLDYLEVSDDQLTLTVYFLGPAPLELTLDNFEISGGERIRGIRIVDMVVCPQHDPELDNCIVLTLDRPGDFSSYRLCLVNLPPASLFDPRYLCLSFNFKVSCPSELDCKQEKSCPPEPYAKPDLDYLAKDYASFRQLILDRLSVVMPDWKERHIPDLGITLVEILAYVGDYLSYYQDAVATEAYLDTARQRISVRRHARLVDYLMHEGCNARTWVHIHTSMDGILAADQISFLTRFSGAPEVEDRLLTWDDLKTVPGHEYEVFEPLLETPDGEIRLYLSHNEIHFYTWGDRECCLPRGATSAWLIDGAILFEEPPAEAEEPEETPLEPTPTDPAAHDPEANDDASCEEDAADEPSPPQRLLHLRVGDLLIFEEVIGARTGDPDDADPAHRHVVRLTRVEASVDPLNGLPLLAIAWSKEDALPFPLCLSVVGPAPECALIEHVTVARGNLVLSDHGRRLDEPEGLGCVAVQSETLSCVREGRAADPLRIPGEFSPVLKQSPLTFSQPLAARSPASQLLHQDPRLALPWIRLSSWPDPDCQEEGDAEAAAAPPAEMETRQWETRRDLLASQEDENHFVVEMDDRRRAHLRFGDGELGARPQSDQRFEALYRVGNGPQGNIGADKLLLLVSDTLVSGLRLQPRNPLPASGGTAPEAVADVKLFAPHAFRQVLERGITPEDYAQLAAQHPKVARAAAELRWNGSWYEMRVAVDPLGEGQAEDELLREVERYLYRFRRIGHDLAVLPAHYVALDLVLEICVDAGYLRGHVKAALLQGFSNGCLADGTLGLFHPDALSFDQDISLSRLVAAALAVPGVASARVTRLQRLFEGADGEIEQGVLPIGPLEIARLDNDPNFPEHGRIRFELRGGR
ncbi:MAG: putative baseplate assembly protein [Candidatus Thiodiazotropha sp.]